MYKDVLRPAWAEINLDAIEYNIKSIRNRVGDAEIIGVVKADGYGCGAVPVAGVLRENGVKMFATATITEAIELKDNGFEDSDIIVLGLSPALYADALVEKDIIPAVDSYDVAKALSDAATEQGKTARLICPFDTGMGRIGFRPEDDYVGEIKKMQSLPNLEIVGMFSHMSTADFADKTYSMFQLENFKNFIETLEENGIEMKIKSFSNSASIVDLPETYYTHVRPGCIMYGHYSDDEIHKDLVPLKDVMTVKAVIMKLKYVEEGDSVGYGRKYRAPGHRLIATFNLGYADGMPRIYSPNANVIINGVLAPVAGNVCMDQFMVDVTDVPNVKVGDEAIIMGSDGKEEITAEYISEHAGTIFQETYCRFSQRLPRLYFRNGERIK